MTDLILVEDSHKWNAALDALKTFGPDAASAVPEKIRLLPKSMETDEQLPYSSKAIWVLGRIAPGTKMAGEAIAALQGILRTGTPRARRGAISALGEFGPAAASVIPDLIRSLKEPTPKNELLRVDDSAASALRADRTGHRVEWLGRRGPDRRLEFRIENDALRRRTRPAGIWSRSLEGNPPSSRAPPRPRHLCPRECTVHPREPSPGE